MNQGCPVSPAIFTQTCAIMEHLIKQNSNIKGINIKGLGFLLSQFTDDTGAFLTFDPICINEFCNVLATVERQVRLNVSYEKTSLYRVGSLANTNAKCYMTKPVSWSNGPVETLGLSMSCDGSANDVNFNKIVTKLDNVIGSWSTRSSSLSGKILIVNTLISSLFVYSMTTMLDLT